MDIQNPLRGYLHVQDRTNDTVQNPKRCMDTGYQHEFASLTSATLSSSIRTSCPEALPLLYGFGFCFGNGGSNTWILIMFDTLRAPDLSPGLIIRAKPVSVRSAPSFANATIT